MSLVLMLSVGSLAFAQAPQDLSYLTNRATLASHLLKDVNEIEVSVTVSSAGAPTDASCPPGYVCTTPVSGPTITANFPYSGPPSFSAMAKSLKGKLFTPAAPIPDSYTTVTTWLKGGMPNGIGKQYLIGGVAGGKPEFDGTNWRLPKDASEPPMYLNGTVFIPVPGLLKAWVVETNQWGWAIKKSLSVWSGIGLYFETSLAGEVFLCFEVDGKGGSTSYVYDLRNGGQRAPLPLIMVAVSIRDSEDIRDYGDNATSISHWVYTYKPENSELTYGKVPLLVANYMNDTAVMISVGSSVGYARKFSVTRIADSTSPEQKFMLEIPDGGLNYYGYTFKPGLYHIVPLGINVCPDWWKILEVDGWNYGGGGMGKGFAGKETSTTEVVPVQ